MELSPVVPIGLTQRGNRACDFSVACMGVSGRDWPKATVSLTFIFYVPDIFVRDGGPYVFHSPVVNRFQSCPLKANWIMNAPVIYSDYQENVTSHVENR